MQLLLLTEPDVQFRCLSIYSTSVCGATSVNLVDAGQCKYPGKLRIIPPMQIHPNETAWKWWCSWKQSLWFLIYLLKWDWLVPSIPSNWISGSLWPCFQEQNGTWNVGFHLRPRWWRGNNLHVEMYLTKLFLFLQFRILSSKNNCLSGFAGLNAKRIRKRMYCTTSVLINDDGFIRRCIF